MLTRFPKISDSLTFWPREMYSRDPIYLSIDVGIKILYFCVPLNRVCQYLFNAVVFISISVGLLVLDPIVDTIYPCSRTKSPSPPFPEK